MRTHLRHDLTDHAVVGYVRREGDDEKHQRLRQKG